MLLSVAIHMYRCIEDRRGTASGLFGRSTRSGQWVHDMPACSLLCWQGRRRRSSSDGALYVTVRRGPQASVLQCMAL